MTPDASMARPSTRGKGGGKKAAATTPYYVRKIDVGRRYKAFGEGGANSALSKIAGDDGRIQIGMEIDALIRDVAPDLYKDFAAFVREDMNNALRQVRMSRAKKRKAHVHVVIDRTARTVEVHDVETEGMPVSVFRDVYTVLGRSGNLDGRESGQKGIGRFAYLGASDTKIVETQARETGERYGFLVRGGKVFEPIPDEMLSIDWYGTRTSVCVDEQHDFDKLPAYARAVAAAATVPVYLTTRGFSRDVEMSRINGKGGRGCACKDAMRIETDDFTFVGCGRCKELPNRGRHAAYLIGIPIDVDWYMGPVSLFRTTTLNIHDERKYEPTTSRDSLSESAAERISEAVLKEVWAEMLKLECDPIGIVTGGEQVPQLVEYLISNMDAPCPGRTDSDGNPVLLRYAVTDSVQSAVHLLRTRVDMLVYTDSREFNGEVGRARLLKEPPQYGDNHDIANIIVSRSMRWLANKSNELGKPIAYAPAQSLMWRRSAYAHVEAGKGPVILLKEFHGWEWLERLGIKRIDSIGGRGGVNSAPNGKVKVMYDTTGVAKSMSDLGPNDICVPKDPGVTRIRKTLVEMRKRGMHLEHIGVFPWCEGASSSNAQMFDRLRSIVDARVYETSNGPMTGREIIDTQPARLARCPSGNTFVSAMCDHRVASVAAGRGRTAVYTADDADSDRLWLAYGYEHNGLVPNELEYLALAESALLALGVPTEDAKYTMELGIPKVRSLVGELRMLRSPAQKAMYMRGFVIYHENMYGYSNEALPSTQEIAVFLSETDPDRDEYGLCLDIVRDLNASGKCDSANTDPYDRWWWRDMLMGLALDAIGRAATGGRVMSIDRRSVMSRHDFATTAGAFKMYRDVLRHLFGTGTTVRMGNSGYHVFIDAVLGRGAGGEKVRLGGTLFGQMFGSAKKYTLDTTDDGRLRICGGLGDDTERYDKRRRGDDDEDEEDDDDMVVGSDDDDDEDEVDEVDEVDDDSDGDGENGEGEESNDDSR